ncbi:MAG: hypothetical protein KJ622_13515 [Alphaproteobacteria bacterium]|nr:hypothetical protein [Alphaproteobacteria bacterium]
MNNEFEIKKTGHELDSRIVNVLRDGFWAMGRDFGNAIDRLAALIGSEQPPKPEMLPAFDVVQVGGDNQGNRQLGGRIYCSDGQRIDYPLAQRIEDAEMLRLAMIDVPVRRGEGTGSTVVELGDLPSPLSERCEKASADTVSK